MLGEGWPKNFGLLPQLVNQLIVEPALKLVDMFNRHVVVFKEELGQLKGTTAKIYA